MEKIKFEYPDRDGNIQILWIDKDEWEAFQRFRNDKMGFWGTCWEYPLTPDECIKSKQEQNVLIKSRGRRRG
jgi:hypothetical protein